MIHTGLFKKYTHITCGPKFNTATVKNMIAHSTEILGHFAV